MICAACNKELLSGDAFLECTLETCGKVYHYLCNNRELTLTERSAWICPECSCAAKKGGCNDNLPIPLQTPISQKYISARNKSNVPAYRSPADSSHFPEMEIQLLREQINILSERLTDAVSTIDKYHTALALCSKQIQECNEKLSKFENVSDCHNCHLSDSCTPVQAVVESDSVNNIQVPVTKPKLKSKPKPKAKPKPKQLANNHVTDIQKGQEKTFPPPNMSAPPEDYVLTSQPHELQSPILPSTINNHNSAEEWTEVRSKKPRRVSSLRGTAGPETTTLKAVEYRKYIHLWNMVSGTEEVQTYLQKLFPEAGCTIEELKPKGDYKSFKIGVPPELYLKCVSPNIWPTNARVKEWFFRRQPTKSPHKEY